MILPVYHSVHVSCISGLRPNCCRALRRYDRAIQYVDGVPPGDYSDEDDGFDDSPSIENERGCREEEVGTDEWSPLGGREAELVDLQVAILCNQAACHLKLGDGAAALEVADRASTFKAPVDGAAGVKAAYRRACALEAVGDLDEARVAFKSVLDVDPKNSQSIQVITSMNDEAVLLQVLQNVCLVGSESLRGQRRTNL